MAQIEPEYSPYKNLIVEFYDETCVKHPKAELFFHEENIGKYRFMKKDITAAQLIQEISEQIAIKDVTIEEATIDDIIRIAYHKES